MLFLDPGSEIGDPRWVKIRNKDKHPGSATLVHSKFSDPHWLFQILKDPRSGMVILESKNLRCSNYRRSYKANPYRHNVADPGCLSRILIFTYPGSRIPDPKTATKGGVKNIILKPIPDLGSRGQKGAGSRIRISNTV